MGEIERGEMITLLVRNEEEAQPLFKLARKAAKGLQRELQLIFFSDEVTPALRGLSEEDPEWMQQLGGDHEAMVCGGGRRYQLAEQYLVEHPPKLLILGKHLNKKAENTDTKFSRHLYQSLDCQTVLIRLGEQEDLPETKLKHEALPEGRGGNAPILVSCGHGPHTQRALKLAYALSGRNLVAFHLAPDVDRTSRDYAREVLRKIVKRAGIDPDEVTLKVVLGEDVSKALREEAVAGHGGEAYAMMLLGYSQNRGLKEKLFGTVPEQMVNKAGGLTIGVIRAARPVGQRIREMFSQMIRVKIPQLEREDRIALFHEIETKSRWSFDFATLMTLAALVAGLGLLVDSGAVVIGAMLIAPLMMPLIGSGLALAQGHSPLFKSAFLAVLRGFLCALLTGFALGGIAQVLHLSLTGELAARGYPNVLDLGVAFVSGVAASYCIARPTLTGALAGVAIAAALVPPIVTVGICLAIGEWEVARGAGLLFGTNVVAVVLGASLNFILAGIRGQGKAGDAGRRLIFLFALACLGLAVPLSSVLLDNIPQLEARLAVGVSKEEVELVITQHLEMGAELQSMSREVGADRVSYRAVVSTPQAITPEEYQLMKAEIQAMHTEIQADLSLEYKIVYR